MSSPTVGSSSSSSAGSWISARASSTRRRWPPDSSARPVAPAVGEADALQFGGDARARRRGGHAVQRRVVEQVLLHGQVEIERRLLEHHAHAGPAPPRAVARMSWPNTAMLPLRAVEQAGDQREQRRLAGAVQPEQHGEIARRARGKLTSCSTLPRAEGVVEPGTSNAGSAVRRAWACSRARPPRPMATGRPAPTASTLQVRHVDHRHVVADAVGGVEPLAVGRESHVPDALADQQVFLHLVGLGIDHRHAVGRARARRRRSCRPR